MTLPEDITAKRPLDVDEVAEYLRISRASVFKLLKSGELRARKIAGQWRVSLEALDELLVVADNAPKGGKKHGTAADVSDEK